MELQAWYRDEASAAEAVKALRRDRISRVDMDFREIRDEKADPTEEHIEGSEIVAGPGLVMSKPQFIGGGIGTMIGALTLGGAALLVALILLATGAIGTLVFVVIVVGFAVAGGVAGVVLGGSAGGAREVARANRGHDRWIIVQVDPGNEREASRAKEIFQRTRADRVA